MLDDAAGKRSRLFGVITISGRSIPGLHLSSQQMKILRRRGRITNLQIVLRAELQITFKPRAGVFRPLSFVTVRQQHHEPRRLFPFVFRSGDVLIDDRLRAVAEITKLRFPQDERVLSDDRIAVLKSQHAFFRQASCQTLQSARQDSTQIAAPTAAPTLCRSACRKAQRDAG